MKILMVTMSLDIGGAETHITELSCELKRMGHQVTVASNGGIYVKKLEQNGIRHLTVPLHTKNPLLVVKAYNLLYRDIAQNKYDIVHAHARIPSYICGLLSKRLPFRFVTTCHGVYAMNMLWKKVANWGEKSLAVSCDIKNYLISQYGVYSSNISLTINGINSAEFSSYSSERENVCNELDLSPTCPLRIIHVSRIDRESSFTADILCDSIAELSESFGNIELIIVGGGTAFADIKEKADNINTVLRRKAVTLTGPRTDIARLLSVGDIFVGVSRAALEAMAAAKPVILCGSPSYGQGCSGIFCSDNLDANLSSNFTARGCQVPTVHDMTNLLSRLISLDAEQRSAMGTYNRSIVEEYYPISKMAEDALSVYRSLEPFKREKHSDVIISGYYGYGNAGDDSLLRSIIDSLRSVDRNISITVLSARPKETSRLYNVRSVARFNLPAIVSELKQGMLLINGSGNLFQNSTSSRSLFYYTTLTKFAHSLGCRTMMYAGGIGPINGSWAEKVSRETISLLDTVTLRESLSLEILQSFGLDTGKYTVTADPALLLPSEDPRWVDCIMSREHIPHKFFVIALRDWSDTRADFEEIISSSVKEIKERYGLSPVFAVMQPGYDDKVCARVASSVSPDTPILRGLNACELKGILSKAEFVIGMRLHSIVYAASVSTPFIGLAYDTKIKAFTSRFAFDRSFRSYIDVKEATSSAIISSVDYLLTNRTEIVSTISSSVAEQRSLALTDANRAIDLLKL